MFELVLNPEEKVMYARRVIGCISKVEQVEIYPADGVSLDGSELHWLRAKDDIENSTTHQISAINLVAHYVKSTYVDKSFLKLCDELRIAANRYRSYQMMEKQFGSIVSPEKLEEARVLVDKLLEQKNNLEESMDVGI